jgi:hypothetical protein
VLKGCFDQVPDAVGFSCGDDIVLRFVLLEHQPHRPHVVRRVAPVAAGFEVAEHQLRA